MNSADRSRFDDILSAAIQYSNADEVFAVLSSTVGETTRIADGIASAPHATNDAGIQITVRKGKRYGSAQTNALKPEGIRRAMDTAAAQAAIMPEVEQIVPFPSAVDTPHSAAAEKDTIGASADADALIQLLERAKQAALRLTGSIVHSTNTLSIASSNGLSLHHPSTLVHMQFRLYSDDGWSTGYAERFDPSFSRQALLNAVDTGIQKCHAWRDPVELPAGRHSAVIEPRALADLLKPMMTQFTARAVEEGRSFLRKLDGSSFVGTKLFDERITLRSDPLHPECSSLPFTMDGSLVPAATWVRDGVIEQVVRDRYDAAGTGTSVIPPPTNLIMHGGEKSRDELITNVERGLLISGFSELQIIDPSNCLLTGSTRDGLFLIEDGRISKAVRNVMLRETPVYLMKEVESLGTAERTSTTGSFFPMVLPTMRVKDVLFSGSSGMI